MHLNTKYSSVPEGKKHADGLAVLSVLLTVGSECIISIIYVTIKTQPVCVEGCIAMHSFVSSSVLKAVHARKTLNPSIF